MIRNSGCYVSSWNTFGDIIVENIINIKVLEVLVIQAGIFIVGYLMCFMKLDVPLSELQFKMLMLKFPIRIVSFFSLANFSKRETK